MTITKQLLSGSTNGRKQKVTGTATGTAITVHTAHATALDEIWLWAMNTGTGDNLLTVEFGGTTSPDDLILQTIPADDGLYLVVPGLILTGSVLLKAFADAGDVIQLVGYVNRIV